MPTFEPPLRPGKATTVPERHPGNPVMRFYSPWQQGITVWKDSLGVYHESMTPYLGGATHAVYDGAEGTISAPDEGLATAQVVYLGGHVHTITAAEATDLTNAGYGAYITP